MIENENLISRKISSILSSDEQIHEIARRSSIEILNNKRRKRYFDEVYKSQYDVADLDKKKPFLNIGPGSFQHPYWRLADKYYDTQRESWTQMRRNVVQPTIDYQWDIYEGLPFPEDSNYFKVIYSSHVIEHLFKDDVDHYLSEVYRLLEPNGVFRVVCPDADKLAYAYKHNNFNFSLNYLVLKTNRLKFDVFRQDKKILKGIIAHFVLDFVSLVVNKKNSFYLSTYEKKIDFLNGHEGDIYAVFDEASQMSDRNLNKSLGGHVNWFNEKKLINLLEMHGFSKVKVSRYKQSDLEILRDDLFDRSDPEMSLYLEAQK